ncbi:MAG: hypothetical protein ACRERD_12420 [Candidatus Binatia bacterium]
MDRTGKRAHERYIEVGYEDKVVFTPQKKLKVCPDVATAWRSSQGLWADHPVFQDMTTKEVIEWFRGEDCDV